jgi:hypothetical protein
MHDQARPQQPEADVSPGQRIAKWPISVPSAHPVAPSCISHPAYGLDALRTDLDRLTFLLGGNDGESLLGENPAWPRNGDREKSWEVRP